MYSRKSTSAYCDRAPRGPTQSSQAARAREKTKAFAKRAGIEGTLLQGVCCCDLRRARYIGLAKTHLQHILIAAAMNLMRVAHWLAEEPLARARPLCLRAPPPSGGLAGRFASNIVENGSTHPIRRIDIKEAM